MICKWDDPILKTKCLPVTIGMRMAAPEKLDLLIQRMHSAMIADKGIGLAAPQIGEAVRVIIVMKYILQSRSQGPAVSVPMINPVIVAHSEQIVTEEEGCLSYPGVRGPVERFQWVKVRYERADGIVAENEYRSLAARVIQHEIDHLDGVCKVGDLWRERGGTR